MAVSIEKLLVLKAYYMGHAVSEKPQSKPVALEMVNAAIRELEQKSDTKSMVRLLFYLLLKAEIKRKDSDVITWRIKAKHLAETIGGDVFDSYMAIEEATQTKKKAYGLPQGYIADKGIEAKKQFVYFTSLGPAVGIYDAACRSIGVDEHHLTDKEHNFLHHISLR